MKNKIIPTLGNGPFFKTLSVNSELYLQTVEELEHESWPKCFYCMDMRMGLGLCSLEP